MSLKVTIIGLYKSKSNKKMVTKKCKNCGAEFTPKKEQQILCENCINSLDKVDRQKIYENNRVEKSLIFRTCLNCGDTFIIKKPKKDAKSTRVKLFCNNCISTLTTYQRKKIRMEKDPSYREHVLAEKRESHKRNIVHSIWKRAKDRAKKYNYEFNITEDDIIIPDKCPLLNIPIFCGDKDNYENSPSLDRIDNTKGYIKGNVWVISKKANSMKNSASFSELKTFCQNIKRYNLTSDE